MSSGTINPKPDLTKKLKGQHPDRIVVDVFQKKVMPRFLLTWLITAAALMITANFVPGFVVKSFGAALVAAVVLGLVNAIIRPILFVLTLPITIVTLGLFMFVVNALTILLAGNITPGFHVAGFVPALVGSIVLTIVGSVLNFVVEQFV